MDALPGILKYLLALRIGSVGIVQVGAERHQHHGRTAGIAERMHNAGRDRQPQYVARRHVDVLDFPLLLEPHAARPDHRGGFHRGPVHVIAAYFIGLREHHVNVLLSLQLRVRQGLEQRAARVAMDFYRLHRGAPPVGMSHDADYNVIASQRALER